MTTSPPSASSPEHPAPEELLAALHAGGPSALAELLGDVGFLLTSVASAPKAVFDSAGHERSEHKNLLDMIHGARSALDALEARTVVAFAETTRRDHIRAVRDGTDLVVTHRGADTSDTTVHFGAPSDADLDVYLRTGEPLECAGAFTIESLGGWFIDRIEGDPSSVIGLSLPLLRRLLAGADLHAHHLWRPGLVG